MEFTLANLEQECDICSVHDQSSPTYIVAVTSDHHSLV